MISKEDGWCETSGNAYWQKLFLHSIINLCLNGINYLVTVGLATKGITSG